MFTGFKSISVVSFFLMMSNVCHLDTFAFSFTNILPDFTIRFTSILPDETWYIAGRCSEPALGSTSIKIVSVLPDKTIRLTKQAMLADRSICIVNPSDAPEEFWEELSKF